MKIKKYKANTMPEALEVIREDLGPDAVILHSKEVKKNGLFGFFGKKKIEVIAALDPQPIQRKAQPKIVHKPTKEARMQEVYKPSKEQDTILAEIKHLKKIVELQSLKDESSLAPDFQLIYNHLINQEVDETLAKTIIEEVNEAIGDTEESVERKDIEKAFKHVLTEKLKKYPAKAIHSEHKVVQFVGPTGVGKTTTIAKIAAKLMLDQGKKVAFITSDTYRIGAVEQLKTYARILNVPLEVAYNLEDYQNAVEKFNDVDIILVDTAGRNFRDKKYVQELQKLSIDQEKLATYLVLSLTAKPKDLSEIYDQFHLIPLESVIFTKIDETKQYGSMLNIVLNKEIGISYVTNGQDVPDNILQLTEEDITKLVVGDLYD
ncbi:flagellar biosynthesis protein FlhF [Oceanobacillus sp. CAU 1775]